MSIYRGHFTVASLLASWLELGPVKGLFDVSLASRIDATQARLQGIKEAQPLPAKMSLPLLRAFDGLDIPEQAARSAMDETLLYGKQVAESQEDSRLEALLQAPKLESFIAAWPLCRPEQAEAALMAARQLRWTPGVKGKSPVHAKDQALPAVRSEGPVGGGGLTEDGGAAKGC